MDVVRVTTMNAGAAHQCTEPLRGTQAAAAASPGGGSESTTRPVDGHQARGCQKTGMGKAGMARRRGWGHTQGEGRNEGSENYEGHDTQRQGQCR